MSLYPARDVRITREAVLGKSRSWSRSGVIGVVAALAGLGLTACENVGTRAGEAILQPSPSPRHHRPSGPNPRAAKAFVRKTFVLYDRGQSRRACAFSESGPYRAADHSCVTSSARAVAQLHSHGIRAVPQTITVHVHGNRGTAIYAWTVNGHHISNLLYLRYDGHRWWMTGERKSGDLGL